MKAAEEKLRESEAAAANPFDFSNLSGILNNPEFMAMAQNVMKQPQFADMVNQIASNLGQGGLQGGLPDFSQMFANLAAQQPADGSIPEVVNTPFGDIKREQLESLQHMPEIKDNPKFHAIMEDVKTSGPMAMLKTVSCLCPINISLNLIPKLNLLLRATNCSWRGKEIGVEGHPLNFDSFFKCEV